MFVFYHKSTTTMDQWGSPIPHTPTINSPMASARGASPGGLPSHYEALETRIESLRIDHTDQEDKTFLDSLGEVLRRLKSVASLEEKLRDQSLKSTDCLHSFAAGTLCQKDATYHSGAASDDVYSLVWLQDSDTPKRKFRKTPIRPSHTVDHHDAPSRNNGTDTQVAASAATVPLPIGELPVWRRPSHLRFWKM